MSYNLDWVDEDTLFCDNPLCGKPMEVDDHVKEVPNCKSSFYVCSDACEDKMKEHMRRLKDGEKEA